MSKEGAWVLSDWYYYSAQLALTPRHHARENLIIVTLEACASGRPDAPGAAIIAPIPLLLVTEAPHPMIADCGHAFQQAKTVLCGNK